MPQFVLDFDLSFSFRRSFGTLSLLYICVFGLFTIRISHSVDEDHAGFRFNTNILGLDIDFSNIDVRHYDYDNEKWEDCNIEEINAAYDNRK
jgi:hypothetical protein